MRNEVEEILERMRKVLSYADEKISKDAEWAERVIANWNKTKMKRAAS